MENKKKKLFLGVSCFLACLSSAILINISNARKSVSGLQEDSKTYEIVIIGSNATFIEDSEPQSEYVTSYYSLLTKTSSNYDFSGKLKVMHKLANTDNSTESCIVGYQTPTLSGNICLDTDFTLRNIGSPISMTYSGQFVSAVGTEYTKTYGTTAFKEKEDGSWRITISIGGYTFLLLDTITITYIC